MRKKNNLKEVTIIGGGLGGTMMAIFLAKKGYEINIYESRGDLRKDHNERGRSINMTLSARGISALTEVGVIEEVMKHTVPLRGRVVHNEDRSTTFQPYGVKKNEVIHSILRNDLNMILLNATDTFPKIKIHFHQRCFKLDKKQRLVHLVDKHTGERYVKNPSFVIGSDGAFSLVRQQINRGVRADYQQDFLDWGYKELLIPARNTRELYFEKNGLHMWPRGDSLILGMQNTDGTFNCTCVLPYEGELSFHSLNEEQLIKDFFVERFPELVELVPNLIEMFKTNPIVDMVTIKTNIWYFEDWCVMLGDSCHALVPFYGQGMNVTFQGCSVLAGYLEQFGDDRQAAFAAYQNIRKPDTDIMADLSKSNFRLLCKKVSNYHYHARRTVDLFMNKLFPKNWMPLYTMIAHTDIPIAEVLRIYQRRTKLSKWLGLDFMLNFVAIFFIVKGWFARSASGDFPLESDEEPPLSKVNQPTQIQPTQIQPTRIQATASSKKNEESTAHCKS